MIYYIYKITLLKGNLKGHYYIGKHKTDKEKDYYYGSGKIVKDYYKKYGKKKGVTFTKEIVEYNLAEEINNLREKEIIGDLYKTDPLCLNLKYGGEGGRWEKGMTAINKGKKATPQAIAHQIEAQKKRVLQYDVDGTFIKEWESEKDVDNYYGGINNVNKALRKNQLSYGYQWRLKVGDKIPQNIGEYVDKRKMQIDQYTKDGVFVRRWNSIAEAAEEYGVSIGAIYNAVVQRNRCKSSVGYVWKYAKEKEVAA